MHVELMLDLELGSVLRSRLGPAGKQGLRGGRKAGSGLGFGKCKRVRVRVRVRVRNRVRFRLGARRGLRRMAAVKIGVRVKS